MPKGVVDETPRSGTTTNSPWSTVTTSPTSSVPSSSSTSISRSASSARAVSTSARGSASTTSPSMRSTKAVNVDHPEEDEQNFGFFIVDEDECTRCALCIDRCPTGVISLGKFEGSLADQAAELGLDRRPGTSTPASVTSRTAIPMGCAGRETING